VMEMRQIGKRKYIMVDLLFDLIIYPNGQYHLLDVDEFADSIEKGLLKKRQQVHALRTLDRMIRLQTERKFIPRFVKQANMFPLAERSRN
jgi:predicted RNA-binding protein associated with RNAse of E/G family